jgi:DNA-binding LacI/PurR family transcriptional regulator
MQGSPPAKYKVLRDELIRAIRSGEFTAGQRLPAERELAARFGVRHMTARQAVTDLVESELLDRRSRSGIYVHANSREKLSTTTLNLICYASDDSVTTQFLKFGTQCADGRGWRTRITRSREGYERPIARAVQAGEPSLVFLDLPSLSRPLRNAMIHSDGRAVMIGNRFDDHGVPSVMADDRLAMQMAISHLKEAGHTRVGLCMSNPAHPVVALQIEAWKEGFAAQASARELDARLVEVPVEEFHSGTEASYEAMLECLRSGRLDVTAFIFLDDGMALGGIAACRALGVPVPAGMSFVCTMDSDIMHYTDPGVTVIDVGIESHVRFGLDLVDAALTGELPKTDRLRLVQPRLVKRASVAPPAKA